MLAAWWIDVSPHRTARRRSLAHLGQVCVHAPAVGRRLAHRPLEQPVGRDEQRRETEPEADTVRARGARREHVVLVDDRTELKREIAGRVVGRAEGHDAAQPDLLEPVDHAEAHVVAQVHVPEHVVDRRDARVEHLDALEQRAGVGHRRP